MSRMIDQIRQSAVPANVMRTAARGALSLPAAEMIEILVLLAANPIFGEEARLTLAQWDEKSALEVASNPATAPEVLEYLISPKNRRPALLPALLENPSVPESALMDVAEEQSREVAQMLLASPRARRSANVLYALYSNPVLDFDQGQQVQEALAQVAPSTAAGSDAEADEVLEQYVEDHCAEIAAEEGKEFRVVGSPEEETPEQKAAAAAPVEAPHQSQRLSVFQKIARLSVGERVQLAMKGSKDERFVLVRDGAKVVATAVLESPKLTDQEVETYAAMKNVQEAVLRTLASRRKFMKNYSVIRNLANNPRCPLDVQLTLVKNLLPNDLRTLSMNKNVGDTVRRVAMKLHKERTDKK